MGHPSVEAIMNRAWCPGVSILDQEPYKIRLMIGHEIQPQKYLFCGNLSETGKSFSVSARWQRDNFITAANECRLCDIFKMELPDIVNGGTFETCDTIQLPGPITAPTIQDVINDGLNNYLWDSSLPPALLIPAWYGGTTYQDGFSEVDFRPWFNFLAVLKQGACKIGWKLKAPIFENSMFRRLWTYILSKDYGNQAFINQYGSLEAAFNAYKWIVAVTSGTNLYTTGFQLNNDYCISFNQNTADPQGVVSTGTPWTSINHYTNLMQGVCLRYKLFQTNEDWEGSIKISVYQIDNSLPVGGVPTPAGGNIPIFNPAYNLIAEQSHSISFDEDNPEFILEGEIDIDCIDVKKPQLLDPGSIFV